jgi:pyruvate,water dikinase
MGKEFILWFEELSKEDIPIVGGKCANLGEVIAKTGIPVPKGFAITADAYRYFIQDNAASEKIEALLKDIDVSDIKRLEDISRRLRRYIEGLPIPKKIEKDIIDSYNRLSKLSGKKDLKVAVRSSATAEDLPGSSFAGQQDTYLNISKENLIDSIKRCWSSLFTPRAIVYRKEKGFSHLDVLISVAVQELINSQKSGVMFTIEPVSGNRDVIVINASWGLGEAIVSGLVTPDEYVVSKEDFKIVQKNISKKEKKVISDNKGGTIIVEVEEELKSVPALTDEQVVQLAKYGKRLEEHYGSPQDIEWAVDDRGKIFILQVRPETLFGKDVKFKKVEEKRGIDMERDVIVRGIGVSPGQASGKVKIIMNTKEISKFEKGDVLVTDMTTPDWVPIMKIAAAIITNAGGKTCHAAIVSRELGVPCVVGTLNATNILKDGEVVTVDGQKGLVYKGDLLKGFEKDVVKFSYPHSEIVTATKVYVNLSIPEIAKKVAEETNADGVGLLRAEHLMLTIGKHPRLLIEEGGEQDMINTFAKGVGQVAEAFFPKPVVYRFLDFKPDEFLDLPGGERYEREHVGPNPMIGYRGEYRYVKEDDIFRLELRAIKQARNNMGYKNIWVMIPFVRTLEIFKKTVEIMQEEELDHKNDKSFQLWIMVEVPSAVFLIKELCEEGIDGVSFGTNDLTMLVLGVDRNDKSVQDIYDERNLGVLRAIAYTMTVCRKYGVTTSICGQAPSVYPDYLEFMIRLGCTSVSVNPDAVLSARKNIANIEKKILMEKALGLETKPKIAKIPIEKVFFWREVD